MLKDKEYINEIESGNNFGYVLSDNSYFVSTDYKVLQNQSNGIFVKCMKMFYNGKIQLYYMTDECIPMSGMLVGITPDVLINIVVNMFGSIIAVKNNGFLQPQNIDISWDKIFVEPNTFKVKLVYLPVNIKTFDSYAEFESELRSSIVKLINQVITETNDRLNRFVPELVNGSVSIEDIYNHYKGSVNIAAVPANRAIQQENVQRQQVMTPNYNQQQQTLNITRLQLINSSSQFEILLNKPSITLGKKAEIVDVAITFNRMISRKHCTIVFNNGKLYIADEGSANGTCINGMKLIPHQYVEFKRGDIIKLANSEFQVV
ncbi:FHA domain-containing protein [Agathobacter sp.]